MHILLRLCNSTESDQRRIATPLGDFCASEVSEHYLFCCRALPSPKKGLGGRGGKDFLFKCPHQRTIVLSVITFYSPFFFFYFKVLQPS